MTARQQAVSKEIEYLLYEKVAEDIEQGFRDKGVWTKAFVEAEGDENKTKAKYIALMVVQLQLQIKAGLELQEIFSEITSQDESISSGFTKNRDENTAKEEPKKPEKEPFEDYINDEEKGPEFEDVLKEIKKHKEKASREVYSKVAKARRDLNLKREKPK